jgi:predicted RNA-binding Zn ribbon-like protein
MNRGQQLDLVCDYVNTLDLETGVDRVATPDDLATWFSEQGLVDDLVEPSAREHADALAVREAIRTLLLANNGVATDAEVAFRTLEAAARRAQLAVRFEHGRPVLAPDAAGTDGAVGRLVGIVAELATTEDWARLKACRDAHCRAAFVDRSRNHSRAWCSMEVCGNREKARSFRARHRTRNGER